MPHVVPDIFQMDWADLTGWTDADADGGVSEIDPAGQLHLDLISATDNDADAHRWKDLGTIGTGDYYVEVMFIGDTWDGYVGSGTARGFKVDVYAGTKTLEFYIGNDFTAGDGINVAKAAGYTLEATTWDNAWHRVVFFVHNSQTDVDIWIDKSPATEAADATDVACDFGAGTDGVIRVVGNGSAVGNGEYHIDYIYIGTKLNIMDVTVGEFALTGINAGLARGKMISVTVGAFALTGINALFNKTLSMTVTVGAIALTGITIALNMGYAFAVTVGSYILEGISAIFSGTGSWKTTNQSKSSAISPTNQSQSNISPTGQSKSSRSTFKNQEQS